MSSLSGGGPVPSASAFLADSLNESEQLEAYKNLRRARRRNRIQRVDLFDAFYKAYLMGFAAILAVYSGASGIGDRRLDAHHIAVLQQRGAAFAGIAVALAVAVGLRSGGRGGPLAFERADVRHILLAPIDKRNTIREPALRTLRHNFLVGIAVGAALGTIAAHRLPHALAEWVASGALFGGVTVSFAFGVALIAGGLQIKRWLADLLALAVVGWSVADAFFKLKTAPMTWIASIAFWPLKFGFIGVMSVVVAVAVAAMGVGVINRLSIEAAERRSRLIGQLRFAATLQDVRTVMVIQRQLAQEHARVKPWIRRRPTKRVGVRNGRVALGVYVRRSWAGMLRWPLVRYVRLVIFVGIAAASTVGIWGGTSALIFVAGVALWLAALDLIEGLAQEIDHPDRTESLPRPVGAIHQYLLLTPFLALFALELIAYGVLNLLGNHNIVDKFGPAVFLSAAAAISGAAMAVAQRPSIPTGSVETPEIAGIKFIIRIVAPPLIACAGFIPVVAGQRAWDKYHTTAEIVTQQSNIVLPVIAIAAFPLIWLRYRSEFRTAMAAPALAKEEAAKQKREEIRKDVRPPKAKPDVSKSGAKTTKAKSNKANANPTKSNKAKSKGKK